MGSSHKIRMLTNRLLVIMMLAPLFVWKKILLLFRHIFLASRFVSVLDIRPLAGSIFKWIPGYSMDFWVQLFLLEECVLQVLVMVIVDNNFLSQLLLVISWLSWYAMLHKNENGQYIWNKNKNTIFMLKHKTEKKKIITDRGENSIY